METKFETKETTDVKNYGIFKVQEVTKTSPDGKDLNFVKIKSRDWVSAVVIDQNLKVWMVEQWRHGTDKSMLEFPAGLVEDGELPMDGVIRECCEELGIKKENIHSIEKIYTACPNPAFMDNKMHAFFIKIVDDNSSTEENQNLDDHEFINIHKCDVNQVIENIVIDEDASVMYKHLWAAVSPIIYQLYQQQR